MKSYILSFLIVFLLITICAVSFYDKDNTQYILFIGTTVASILIIVERLIYRRTKLINQINQGESIKESIQQTNSELKEVIKENKAIIIKGGRTKITIGVILNDSVHYANAIFQGFRTELENVLINTSFLPHVEFVIGSPNIKNTDKNEIAFKVLFERNDHYDYFVTIGTNVTEYTYKHYRNKVPIIFIGVSDPEKSVFSNKENRDNISGVKYGLPEEVYLNYYNKLMSNGQVLGVVYNAKYPQDIYFKDNLMTAYENCKNRIKYSLKPIQVNENNLKTALFDDVDLLIGRHYLSTELCKFLNRENIPFVGSSRQNLFRGAIATIGYDDIEIGKLAVQKVLVPTLTENRALKDIDYIYPSKIDKTINLRMAKRQNITITKEFLKEISVIID